MTANTPTQRATATLALVAACLTLGAAIGLMSLWLLSPDPDNGGNTFSEAFGELIVGGLLGIVAGVYLARDLSVTARWWSAGVAILLTAGTLWSLALTAS